MRVHSITHVPFEGLGFIETYFASDEFTLSHTPIYETVVLPDLSDIDWLIVMGGPMGVYDADQYPWLTIEKDYISAAIESGKHVLGICLGAQLMAAALDAPVYKGEHREIGWHPIESLDTTSSRWADMFSGKPTVFHWHGDTFDIPPGAELLVSSKACRNQAFAIGTRVLGLQFHLETTPESAQALIENCGDELDGSQYVQSADIIMGDSARFTAINDCMLDVLERMREG